MTNTTQFAPSERISKDLITEQYDYLSKHIDFSTFNNMPISVLILNKFRQIVFANKCFLKQTQIEDIKMLLGVRPGELLQCVYSHKNPGGCGTSEYCLHCGAVRAVLGAASGKPTENEAKILINIGKKINALNLKINALPLRIGSETYSVVYIDNLASKIDKDMYERVFFHDMLNGITAIISAAKIINEDSISEEVKEMSALIKERADLLADDIKGHRLMKSAEENTLTPTKTTFDMSELIKIATHMNTREIENSGIAFSLDLDNSIRITTDKAILLRAIENIIKNAYEASSPSQKITIQTKYKEEYVIISVHNENVMPEAVKLQIFQRSFSTKSKGRGFGTYGTKLLVQNYLDGTVDFTSDVDTGTTFNIKIPNS